MREAPVQTSGILSDRLPSWDELVQLVDALGDTPELKSICDRRTSQLTPAQEVRLRVELRKQLRHKYDGQGVGSIDPAASPRRVNGPLSAGLTRILDAMAIDLSVYQPLPGYATAAHRFRSELLDLKSRISIYLASDDLQPYSIMLCAAQGLGKSHLAECFAKSLDLHYGKLIIADASDPAAEIPDFLEMMVDGRGPAVALLDEIDTQKSGEFVFQYVQVPMTTPGPQQLVLFMAASAAPSVHEFEAYLATLPRNSKGIDVFSRRRRDVTIPRDLLADPLERVVRALSIATGKNPSIEAVDLDTLLYLANRPFSSTREIQHLVEEAMSAAMAPGATVFTVKGLVSLGDLVSTYVSYPELIERLGNGIVSIKKP